MNSKLINGQITSIDSEIVRDIETLIQVSEVIGTSPLFEHKKNILDAALRVKDYLQTYKLDEPEDGN